MGIKNYCKFILFCFSVRNVDLFLKLHFKSVLHFSERNCDKKHFVGSAFTSEGITRAGIKNITFFHAYSFVNCFICQQCNSANEV